MSNHPYKKNHIIEGYKVIRKETLPDIDSEYIELLHEKSGARHIHIANEDTENTFSVILKTIPKDSTGVAHILEHTALCGSVKFPVRDPFFSMIKRSLNTFMNAFTSSDWTMYPFSTENRKDFYNLMDVYTNAVFYPELSELSFKQEGHRVEREKPDNDQLVFKGVVYNEMKGAMSSPSQVMVRSLLKSLYPDTTYSNNSGGNPSDIPGLTHQALKEFHSRHYHPSNSIFYTYGNLPLQSHLEFINTSILSNFEKIDPDTEVQPQTRWKSPRHETAYYPVSKEEENNKKYQGSVAWLTTDTTDNYEVLILSILSEILLGNAASPLHKALIDSGLGSALSDGSGFDPDNRDTMFSCGLKDIEKESVKKIETIILSTLEDLANKGIERELVDTAIHQIEFHRKERTNSPYPYGIKLMLGIAGTLIHGADPIEVLNLDDSFEQLRKDLKKTHFLEDKIRHYFINNPHRVTFTLSPDAGLQEKEDLKEAEQLEKIRSGLSDEDLKKIDNDTEKLVSLQEMEEDISILPTLSLQDISPDITKIKPSGDYKQIPALFYNQPTSGIYYFSAVSGAGGIDENLLDYIPIFSHVLARIGTSKQNYIKLTRKINATTGGIMVSSQPRTDYTPREECLPMIMFSGKALARNRHHLYDILGELCTNYDFSDLDRLKNLLYEYRAGLESAVVQNGHSFSISLASSTMTQSGYVSERWKGLTHLRFIKQILDDYSDEKIEALSGKLKQIADHIISQNNMKYAIVGQENFLKDSEKLLGSLHTSLSRSGKDGFHKPVITLPDNILQSGMYTNTAVSFVAQAHPVARLNHRDAPALSVISKMMRSMYLHREIREKGGAYGGFAIYNSEDGIFNFGSYRDPHILNTLDVFENASSFLTEGRFTDEDIKEAILQVCSGIDKPDSPGASAKKSFFRHILSLKDEDRLVFKENLLKMNRKRVIQAAETYFHKDIKRSTVVISGKEKLEEANKKLKGKLDLEQI